MEIKPLQPFILDESIAAAVDSIVSQTVTAEQKQVLGQQIHTFVTDFAAFHTRSVAAQKSGILAFDGSTYFGSQRMEDQFPFTTLQDLSDQQKQEGFCIAWNNRGTDIEGEEFTPMNIWFARMLTSEELAKQPELYKDTQIGGSKNFDFITYMPVCTIKPAEGTIMAPRQNTDEPGYRAFFNKVNNVILPQRA